MSSRTDNWTVVRPGTYANNLLSWAYNVQNGLPIRAPYLESAQAPIHEADVADAAVTLLLDFDAHRGMQIPVTGPQALTRRGQVTMIADAVGRDIDVLEISAAEFRQETSQFIPEGIINMLLDYWHDTVSEPDRVRSIRDLCRHDGRPLSQWAHDHRADFGAP